MKRVFAAVAVMVTAALSGGIAHAAWQSATPGSGNAQATATSVGSGSTPTASATGSSVTVSWAASTLAGGAAVSGYQVKRYDATLNTLQTTGAGCSGTITALSCIETGVAVGSWKYSVTPIRDNWTGTESSKSGTVTVAPVVVDTTAPTATITFPVNGNSYNATGFNAGCAANPSHLCGTASDATGVQNVRVSVQQGTGNYWNGTAFSSAIEVFTNATLTSPNATSTDWRLPLSLSTETNYTVRVRTVDTVANTQVTGYAATTTFTYDNTPVTLTGTLSKAGSKVNASGGSSNPQLPKDTEFSVVVCKANSFPCSLANTATTLTAKVGNNGSWSTGNSDNLSNGTYWAQATYTDAAGNVGSVVTNSVTIS